MANITTEPTSKPNGATQDFKNRALGAENHLEKFAQEAGQKIGTAASGLATSASEYVKTSREYVKENPAKGVAIAAAAGAVVGSLLTWAMRRRD